MPLAFVTSVNRSVRVPSALTVRSLRKSRLRETLSVFPSRPGAREPRALHGKEIQVAVVVVVEERSAGSDHFRQQQSTFGAIDVHEVETGLRRHIAERRRGLSAD